MEKNRLSGLFWHERGQITIEYLVTAAAVSLIVYLSCSEFGQATIACISFCCTSNGIA